MRALNGRVRPKAVLCLAAMLLASGAAAGTTGNQVWPKASIPAANDRGLEARVRSIVAGMTLEQKIGQMTQPDIRSVTPLTSTASRAVSFAPPGASAGDMP